MGDNTKVCQLCHQDLPIDNFYKRKDRDGKHNWVLSYCKKCEITRALQYKHQDPEKYREESRIKSNKYYNENKDKVKIIQKRYYYNKLSPERKLKYRQKLLENFPDIVDQICCM